MALQADEDMYWTVIGCLLNGAQTPAKFKQQGLFFDTVLYTHIFSESFLFAFQWRKLYINIYIRLCTVKMCSSKHVNDEMGRKV